MLLAAPTAQATFHLIQIREVYLGSALAPESKYVELQMYSPGQDLVKGHTLRIYNASGEVIGSTTFSANVAADDNQDTILVATSAAETEFELTADSTLPSVATFSPDGGAACWEEIDCVSWGNFDGPLPSPAGTPAVGVPTGMALQRTITRGCATALDPADDSDSSAADFSVATPAPRPNAVAPSERSCASGGGTGGGTGTGVGSDHDHGAPQTTLRRKPPKRTTDRTPSFRFGADEQKARFQCKLDGKAYRACRSPFTAKRLAFGPHTFKVRAIGSGSLADPSPASYRFRVVKPGG